MPTHIKVICPRDGEVTVDSLDCIVIAGEPGKSRLRMCCPQCSMLLEKLVFDGLLISLVATEATIIVPDDASELTGGDA